LASFVFEERVKTDATALVQAFEQAGLTVHLISGDRAPAVHRVAQALSVTRVVAEATPQVKREALQALQAQGQVVLMVGDGLNDAPVMSQADVSIAMGSGAALTQTRADVIIQSAHLGEVLWVNGDQAQAREVWSRGVEIDASNPVLQETMKRFGVAP
jgi:Cu2+-exporting ATPase